MKCQLCDGPVVNGRCTSCGMPYRNDEILYHLNESRSDHYKHAAPKARKIMSQQKVQGQQKAPGQQVRRTTQKPLQEKQRQQRQMSQQVQKPAEKKKNSSFLKVLIVVIIVAGVLPDVISELLNWLIGL